MAGIKSYARGTDRFIEESPCMFEVRTHAVGLKYSGEQFARAIKTFSINK